MNNQLRPEALKELFRLVNDRLPTNGKILCLSLTGSRAFGWANERLDYDIHGLFAAKNAWDWVHYGGDDGFGFDINLYELEYIFGHYPNYLSFEFFQNIIGNPVYLNPKFDYQGLISLCSPNLCFEPIYEISGLEDRFTPRAALHCYRVLMVQIHFLETRTFELNIFKLNEKHKLEMLPVLKQAYWDRIESQGRTLEELEKEKIRQDLAKLLEQFKGLKEKFKDEKTDIEKIEKWKRKASQLWGSEPVQKRGIKIRFLNFLKRVIKKITGK